MGKDNTEFDPHYCCVSLETAVGMVAGLLECSILLCV